MSTPQLGIFFVELINKLKRLNKQKDPYLHDLEHEIDFFFNLLQFMLFWGVMIFLGLLLKRLF